MSQLLRGPSARCAPTERSSARAKAAKASCYSPSPVRRLQAVHAAVCTEKFFAPAMEATTAPLTAGAPAADAPRTETHGGGARNVTRRLLMAGELGPRSSPSSVADAREWVGRFTRQVRALPAVGAAGLEAFLGEASGLLLMADSACITASKRRVIKAYVRMAAAAVALTLWRDRSGRLASGGATVKASPEMRSAKMSFAGARYMWREATAAFASTVSQAADGGSHQRAINLEALPAPLHVGLDLSAMLSDELGLDLQCPASKAQAARSGLSWAQFLEAERDASLVGSWQFDFWTGEASFQPAPHAHFSPGQLAALLELDAGRVVRSMPLCMWGRPIALAASNLMAAADNASGHQAPARTCARDLGAAAPLDQAAVVDAAVVPAGPVPAGPVAAAEAGKARLLPPEAFMASVVAALVAAELLDPLGAYCGMAAVCVVLGTRAPPAAGKLAAAMGAAARVGLVQGCAAARSAPLLEPEREGKVEVAPVTLPVAPLLVADGEGLAGPGAARRAQTADGAGGRRPWWRLVGSAIGRRFGRRESESLTPAP